MRLIILYFLLLLLNAKKEVPQPLPPLPANEAATLIIFLQTQKDQHFIQSTLPKLVDFATERGIEVIQRDASQGLPQVITSTPAVIFQNHRGRNIYAARYTSFSTLQNFIRTSRRISFEEKDNCKTDLATFQSGRSQVGASLKLTALTGEVTSDYDAKIFEEKAKQAILQGLTSFQKRATTCLRKTDRLFYIDFHPYRDSQGKLYLSGAIFSQFNCIIPIWSNFDRPQETSYEDFESAFSLLANQMEEIILRQLLEAKNGDAISFVETSVPIKEWATLDLDLPPAPIGSVPITAVDFDWSEQWKFHGPIDDFTPVVQFRFPEPLERYAGEVTALKGQLTTTPDHQLLSGDFEVATKSLTMGIADFDTKVHKDYIKVKKYPRSSFTFGPLTGQPSIKSNENNPMIVPGQFELMGKTIPIKVSTQIKPILGDQDQSLLQVEATFELNITDDFKIKGPDGPSPANKTLVFNLNFLLTAK